MVKLLIFAFFNLNSVALSERSLATAINPAGLAFSQGLELSYIVNGSNYDFNMLFGNLGVGISNGNSLYLAEGLNLYRNLYLGAGYKFVKGGSGGFYSGLLFRPFDFLSLGATYTGYLNEGVLRGGVAIKPYREYLKAFFDVEKVGDSHSYAYGVAVEPLKGFSLFLTSGKDSPVAFGVQLSLGNILISGTKSDDKYSFGLILSANKYPTSIKEGKVVVLRLKDSYDEMRNESSLIPKRSTSFFDLVVGLDSLANDPEVKGIFVIVDNPRLTLNQVEELRNVFLRFKTNGKKVFFYSEGYFLGSYLLARSGDKIFLNPSGEIFIPGFGTVNLYFKEFLTRLGIKPEAQRIAEYKSAAEPFIMDSMSEYNREQLMAYIETAYRYAMEVVPELDSILENIMFNADEAVNRKLVDSLIYETDIEKVIRSEFGKRIRIVKFGVKANPVVATNWSKPYYRVAYVVADGSIVTGESGENPLPVLGGRNLGSSTIERLFNKLEKDKSVKAVVLRVNSPGGSALASDIMWNAIRKTSLKKPVIVTMGSVAASGGYYISSAGTKVLADRTTLTGSIGVVNLKFVTKGMLEKLGINVQSVKIGKHALAHTSYEELNPEAYEIYYNEMKWYYHRFLKRVEEGRGLPADSVDKIGKGRIWSGEDGVKIGIVNENGGILEALDYAKKMSGVKKIEVYYQPTRKRSFSLVSPLSIFTNFDLFADEVLYYEFTKPLIVR